MRETKPASHRGARNLVQSSLALAGLVVTGLWLLVAAWRAPAPPAAPSDAVLRRDPVRSLAGDSAAAEAPAADAEPVAP